VSDDMVFLIYTNLIQGIERTSPGSASRGEHRHNHDSQAAVGCSALHMWETRV